MIKGANEIVYLEPPKDALKTFELLEELKGELVKVTRLDNKEIGLAKSL